MRPSIIYIMGVAGSGKTTIGKKLAARLAMSFFDGDDFHPVHNKEKMKAGVALTDDDRAGWLANINAFARQHSERGAIIACSALKEKYRNTLSGGITVPLFWVFLKGDYDLIKKRMEQRTDHYMPATLLTSQFEALEMPAQCITIDVSKPADEIVDILVSKISLHD